MTATAQNDGSKFGPECAGHWVITASTKRKPQVVDISNINCELAPQDIYSGMYARVTLNFFSFNSNGNKGVGCGLGNVMKTVMESLLPVVLLLLLISRESVRV